MVVSAKDRSVVRKLAERVAEIAALPIHKRTADLWRRLNGLEKVRPLVWINEIPWHEMDVDGELALQTRDAFCRQVERELRRTIYQWEHMPGDMVVEARYDAPLAIRDTGFGIQQEVELAGLDAGEVRDSSQRDTDEVGLYPETGIVSRHFNPQIQSEKDIEKIRTPRVTHDAQASDRVYQTLVDLFGDILPVQKRGVVHRWFAPWDQLITWWGVQEAMADLVLRPELVHCAMERLVDGWLTRLEQWQRLNVLSLTAGNYRVGSGGLGYTDELPGPAFDPGHVRASDQWGCCAAQILAGVSPEMHEEFGLRYERRWLENFGLTYYGCCEPLHLKIGILETIPNLRKISMSPWIDVDKAVGSVGDRYVFSHKPSPAVFATDDWNLGLARRNLEDVLQKTKGCVVEVIVKDISTVRGEPQRLWEWAEMAMEVVERYA